MAEEKPFDATPSRIARARREGDVPRAGEFVAWASFAAAAGTTVSVLVPLGNAARVLLAAAAAGQRAPLAFVQLAAGSSAPLAAAALAAAVATITLAGGPRLAWPGAKLQKLDPLAGLRRMLSREAAVAALRALAAAFAAGLAAVGAVRDADVAVLGAGGPLPLAAIALAAVRRTVAVVLAVAFTFAIVDAWLERNRRSKRLRMSFDELKRDHKENEGDPLLRGRRRSVHRALVRGSLSRLGEAAFVVVNPTHVAIALEYAPPNIPIPRVLIRAIDEGARLVKARARELRVPIVEHVELARRLLERCEVGALVPPECYDATARVVAALIAAKALA
ncbi:MAG: EscU/YscU/HrcU family type III secretion system export apparatus switch protein [Candidatus Baltobacteraceae bacterium]